MRDEADPPPPAGHAEPQEVRPTAWRREVWAPNGLVLAHGAFGFFCNPIGTTPSESQAWFGVLIGALLSQPLLCAWWAAWAPIPLIQRVPIGLATGVGLLLMDSLSTWDLMLAALFLVLGLVYFSVFSIARLRRGWRFATGNAASISHDSSDTNQFGIRYLMGWTAAVALLCGGAKLVAFNSFSPLPDAPGVLMNTAVFGLLVMPSAVAGLQVLAHRLTALSCVLLGLITVLGVGGAAACATAFNQPRPLGWGTLLTLFSCFSLGSLFSVLISTHVLRWAGYRVTRFSPRDENTNSY